MLLRHHAGVRSKYPRGSIPEQRNTAREVTAAQDPRETSSKIFTTLKTSKQKSLRRPGTFLALLEITLLDHCCSTRFALVWPASHGCDCPVLARDLTALLSLPAQHVPVGEDCDTLHSGTPDPQVWGLDTPLDQEA